MLVTRKILSLLVLGVILVSFSQVFLFLNLVDLQKYGTRLRLSNDSQQIIMLDEILPIRPIYHGYCFDGSNHYFLGTYTNGTPGYHLFVLTLNQEKKQLEEMAVYDTPLLDEGSYNGFHCNGTAFWTVQHYQAVTSQSLLLIALDGTVLMNKSLPFTELKEGVVLYSRFFGPWDNKIWLVDDFYNNEQGLILNLTSLQLNTLTVIDSSALPPLNPGGDMGITEEGELWIRVDEDPFGSNNHREMLVLFSLETRRVRATVFDAGLNPDSLNIYETAEQKLSELSTMYDINITGYRSLETQNVNLYDDFLYVPIWNNIPSTGPASGLAGFSRVQVVGKPFPLTVIGVWTGGTVLGTVFVVYSVAGILSERKKQKKEKSDIRRKEKFTEE